MNNWIASHAVALIAGFYLFSALVSGMPSPEAASGLIYRWVYASLHVLAGDLSHYFHRP
jgi:hypothetical protein